MQGKHKEICHINGASEDALCGVVVTSIVCKHIRKFDNLNNLGTDSHPGSMQKNSHHWPYLWKLLEDKIKTNL